MRVGVLGIWVSPGGPFRGFCVWDHARWGICGEGEREGVSFILFLICPVIVCPLYPSVGSFVIRDIKDFQKFLDRFL